MSTLAAAGPRPAPSREQTRARYPDDEGYVERDGVRVFWERYGDGDPTVLLLPTWTIFPSRVWKAQIAYLARHFRVVTFDPRGNGRSDRPKHRRHYAEREFAADGLAVMDATDTERAVVAGISRGAQRTLLLAAEHPERVLAAAFIGPWFPASLLGGLRWRIMGNPRAARLMFVRPPVAKGWLKFNAAHWLADYRDFAEWWVRRMFRTPHSTKQIEDGIGWALETDAQTMVTAALGDHAAPATRRDQLALARRVQCPVLVVSAKNDKLTAYADAKALAKASGGELLTVPDGSHVPSTRKPVPVNLALRRLVERAAGRRRDPTVHRSDGRKRALYVSSPIGLGHAQRDIAIARELRRLVPGLQVDWLAQHPVTRVLEQEGERIHPASAHLAGEAHHIECESAEHDLHAFQAIRRMDEILVANYMLFHDVTRATDYNVWIADEGWEIDYYLHEHPNEKRAPYAWLTDFVGWLPMPDGGRHEAFLTADYNAEMVEHIARHPDVRDRALFVGNPDDIVGDRLGPQLPLIRDWTERHFDFVGYVTGFDPARLGDRSALRAELGYGDDERVCIVTVGGSGVGEHLLRRVIAAFPEAKERVPDLRMIVVAGPRIEPDGLPHAGGLEVLPYVHNLYRHLAACDLAVVQGGLTTAMELAANKRPFLFFPLRHHFEQNFHVAHRLDRYGAGRRMDIETAPPPVIAEAIESEIGGEVAYRDVETDGARRAAARLAEMLP
ncbi:MAG TPA: alpha/beta fold hydrolase [Solirubrobacteraceae bacterium]|jgi:pimeloyl-ACP methyl ester carboxylesterase/predicted glycosyltransferase|nr:alpha/beta fold hydrolase [Solirubrobacteraceae bacterium]